MIQDTRIEQNKQLAGRAITKGNFDALDEVFTEDYVQHGGVDGDSVRYGGSDFHTLHQ